MPFASFPCVPLTVAASAVPNALRCPRTLPPDELTLAAWSAAPDIARGRSGRVGALVTQKDGRITAHYAFTDFAQHNALLPGPGSVTYHIRSLLTQQANFSLQRMFWPNSLPLFP